MESDLFSPYYIAMLKIQEALETDLQVSIPSANNKDSQPAEGAFCPNWTALNLLRDL